jgi:hypothetical protein
MGTIYTQSDSGFMETPYFEKLADFSCVMWICGGFAPRGPSALLATKKASFGIKTCHLAIPRIMGQKIADFSKYRFFIFWPFMGQKVVFWVKKTVVLSVLDRV